MYHSVSEGLQVVSVQPDPVVDAMFVCLTHLYYNWVEWLEGVQLVAVFCRCLS